MRPCHLMFSAAGRAFGCAAVLLALAGPVRAEVTVVGTYPANGDRAVDPKVATLRIRFSEPVMRDSFSLVDVPDGVAPEFVQPIQYRYEDGDRVLVVTIRLKPSTTYGFGVNDEQYRNFRAAAPPNEPVTPYVLRFTTAPASKPPPKTSAPKKPAPKKPAPKKTPPKKTTPKTTTPKTTTPKTTTPKKTTPKAAVSRAERWQSDLDFLAAELPKRHVHLFDTLTEPEFKRQVGDLRAKVATLDDGAILAGIARIVASVGDAHTSVDVWHNTDPHILPVHLQPFRDGWYVVAVTEPFDNVLGGRVETLGDVDIEEAARRMATFIPHDNASGLRNRLPMYLAHAGLLKAAGIITDTSGVLLTARRPDGRSAEAAMATLTPAAMAQAKINPWFDPNGASAPVSLRSRAKPYAVETMQDGRALYFAYNRCVNDPKTPLGDLLSDLEAKLQKPDVERLVIDLRANGGGNSALLDPFIDTLKTNEHINQRGHLYVLIGRGTFSSAVLNAVRLKTETSAILVGEPTGGRPGHYGEVKSMTLPHSAIVVNYSTKKFSSQGLSGDALEPDLRVEATSQDFVNGRDPALRMAVED